jgi:predicted nucleic acid-binding protein
LKILFDTNVVLDLLLDREPFSNAAAQLFSKAESGLLSGYICATTVTTIHYLACKVVGDKQAKEHIRRLLILFSVAPVNRSVLEGALEAQFGDYDDAVVHEAAVQVNAQGIVTRNISDFNGATIPVYSPVEMLRVLRAQEPLR